MTGRLLRAFLFFAALVALWEVGARAEWWNTAVVPPASDVAGYLGRSAADGSLFAATLVTFRRLLLGYLIGVAVGMPLGFVTSRWQFLSDTVGTVALGLQTLPSVCWAPLAVLAFGLTETTMLFVVVMGTVWSILLATDHGVRSVPPIYLRVARTMGARGLPIVTRVLLPASLPFVVSGMKQGWAFAWRSLMAAEIYVWLASRGLGLLLHEGRDEFAMSQVLGVMFAIVVFGLLADRALFAPTERFLHRRWGTGR